MSINYSCPWILLPLTYYLHNAVVLVERGLVLPVNTLLPYAIHFKFFVSISQCRTTSLALNNCNNGTDLVQNTSNQLQLLTSRNIKTPSANPRYQKTRNSSSFDPRPLKHRQPSKRALEKLRTDLLCLGKPCSFSTILVPDVDVALHDHTYCKPSWEDTNEVTSSCVQIREPCPCSSEELRALCNQVMEGLYCSKEERMKIEFTTQFTLAPSEIQEDNW